jgi:hypothetical protein
MQLAGTVGLPSPFPAVGSVRIVIRLNEKTKEPEFFLRITHRLNYKLKVSRLIELEDARAVLVPGKPLIPAPRVSAQEGPEDWSFITADQLLEHVPKLGADGAKKGAEHLQLVGWWEFEWLPRAIVYASESASVYMEVGVGMTAAESAEYYPPLATGFTDPARCDSANKPPA